MLIWRLMTTHPYGYLSPGRISFPVTAGGPESTYPVFELLLGIDDLGGKPTGGKTSRERSYMAVYRDIYLRSSA